jgi:thymidine kinase
MVQAGYNPLALIVVLTKQTGTYWDTLVGRPANAEKALNVYDYISYTYPEKLKVGYGCNEYRNFLASQFIELKWVLVDECQFLTEQQVDQLSDVVDFLGISVICYGLRTDFQSKLFPASKRLFEIADDLEEIKSTCACGESKTSINARFDENGKIVTEGDQVVIGGNDMYKSLCRKCWKNKIRDKKLAENGEQ